MTRHPSDAPPTMTARMKAKAATVLFSQLREGVEVSVLGVRCRVGFINPGQRRLYLTPVDPDQPMPSGKPQVERGTVHAGRGTLRRKAKGRDVKVQVQLTTSDQVARGKGRAGQ